MQSCVKRVYPHTCVPIAGMELGAAHARRVERAPNIDRLQTCIGEGDGMCCSDNMRANRIAHIGCQEVLVGKQQSSGGGEKQQRPVTLAWRHGGVGAWHGARGVGPCMPAAMAWRPVRMCVSTVLPSATQQPCMQQHVSMQQDSLSASMPHSSASPNACSCCATARSAAQLCACIFSGRPLGLLIVGVKRTLMNLQGQHGSMGRGMYGQPLVASVASWVPHAALRWAVSGTARLTPTVAGPTLWGNSTR